MIAVCRLGLDRSVFVLSVRLVVFVVVFFFVFFFFKQKTAYEITV